MFFDQEEDIIRLLNYFFQSNREKSFTSWIFDSSKKCNVRHLAEAGFFFVGTDDAPDSVMCFYCGKCLDGWEEDDDPWTEHVNHSNGCRFADLQTPEEALSVERILELYQEFLLKVNNQCFDSLEGSTKKFYQDCKKKLLKKNKSYR